MKRAKEDPEAECKVKKAKKTKKEVEEVVAETKAKKKYKKPKDKADQDEASKKPKKVKEKGKKKEKNESQHESKGQNRALRYLRAWDEDRGNWKFEKCRQIWLLQHCYDGSKVEDDRFDVLLKYLGSIRGRMRRQALGDQITRSFHNKVIAHVLF